MPGFCSLILFSTPWVFLFVCLFFNACAGSFVSVWGLSLVVASWGHSSSRCAGLSLSWPRIAEHSLQTRRLSSCGSRAQLLCGMWDLPGPGLEPVPPALAGRFLTTAPPGKPPTLGFNRTIQSLWDYCKNGYILFYSFHFNSSLLFIYFVISLPFSCFCWLDNMAIYYLFFFYFFLKYNLHTTNCTHIRYTV